MAVAKLLRTCIRDCLKPLKPCMDAVIGMLLCVLEDEDDEVQSNTCLSRVNTCESSINKHVFITR